MQKGDIITINGTIQEVYPSRVRVSLKSGSAIWIYKEDINTICPKIEIPEGDKRRGK